LNAEHREWKGRQISRRDFLAASGIGLAGLATLSAAGCGIFAGQGSGTGNGEDAGGTVVVTSSGGLIEEAEKKAWLNPYAEETGTRVVFDASIDYGKLQSMVESGEVTWDIVHSTGALARNNPGTLFEPLDYTVINADGISNYAKDDYRVGWMATALVLGYSTERLGGEPGSWQDFFDLDKFPGKRGISGFAYDMPIEVALLGDGVPPEELYPLDLDRAFAKLDTIKDNLVYWESPSASQQQLIDEEVVMSAIYNGRVQSLVDDDFPLDYIWDQHIRVTDFWTVAKGAPNREKAMELIAYMVSPENNWKLSKYVPYAPVNEESVDQIPQDRARLLPTYGDRPQIAVYPDFDYIADHEEELLRLYSEWQRG
jgi:putative spermidine/putrescine transport system substrate-binding protein